jgi:hypothetical protein
MTSMMHLPAANASNSLLVPLHLDPRDRRFSSGSHSDGSLKNESQDSTGLSLPTCASIFSASFAISGSGCCDEDR